MPANLMFFGAGLVLLMVSLQLSFEVSRLQEETRTLAEEVALLNFTVNQIKGSPETRGLDPPSNQPERGR